MEIIIKIENIINDIGAKYLMELNSTDTMPPKGVLIQGIREADARLLSVIGRYIDAPFIQEADDSNDIGDYFVYTFQMTPRRSAGKGQALATLIHTYLVDASFSKILSIIGQSEMSKKYENMSISDAQAISNLLHKKSQPCR